MSLMSSHFHLRAQNDIFQVISRKISIKEMAQKANENKSLREVQSALIDATKEDWRTLRRR